MNSTNFTPEERKLLQHLYKGREEATMDDISDFNSMWQKADAQKNKKDTYWYLSAAAMIAVVITGLIWSYFSLYTTQPSPNEWPEEFYSTWQMPSDELLTFSIYDFDYTNSTTPTNYLLNPNNEVYYENNNETQDL